MNMLPEYARQALREALEITQHNTGLNPGFMALSYSGRWELLNAVKHIAHDVREENWPSSD